MKYLMWLNQPFIWLVHIYQVVFKPWVKASGTVCIFEESCSRFALRKLHEELFVTAIPKIGWRVLSCNPLNTSANTKPTR